jgi:hypothetical protein
MHGRSRASRRDRACRARSPAKESLRTQRTQMRARQVLLCLQRGREKERRREKERAQEPRRKGAHPRTHARAYDSPVSCDRGGAQRAAVTQAGPAASLNLKLLSKTQWVAPACRMQAGLRPAEWPQAVWSGLSYLAAAGIFFHRLRVGKSYCHADCTIKTCPIRLDLESKAMRLAGHRQ